MLWTGLMQGTPRSGRFWAWLCSSFILFLNRLALDLYTHQMLEIELPFTNPFRHTTMLGYNPRRDPRDKTGRSSGFLYTWDGGNQLTYPVKYHDIGYKEPPPLVTDPPETGAYTDRSPAGLQIETKPDTWTAHVFWDTFSLKNQFCSFSCVLLIKGIFEYFLLKYISGKYSPGFYLKPIKNFAKAIKLLWSGCSGGGGRENYLCKA